MKDVVSRSAMFGAVLLALLTGTTSEPGRGQTATQAAAATAAAANVLIVPNALSPQPMENGVVRIALTAANQGQERARVWFRPVMFDASGNPVRLEVTGLWRGSQEDWIQAGEVVQFTLTLSTSQPSFNGWWDKRLPLKGHLAIETTSETGSVIKNKKLDMRELRVPQIQPAAVEIVSVVVLGIVSAIVLLVAVFLGNRTAPEGSAAWSADSIGANVAIGAGLVSALFAVAGLPELTVYASRSTYGVLIAIFGAVVALASPAANLLSKVLCSHCALFAAGTLVLWGAIGQFIVALLLMLELRQASVVSSATAWVLGGLDVALALAVTAYVFGAVYKPQTREIKPSRMQLEGSEVVKAGEWSIP